MSYQYWSYEKLNSLCNDAFVKFGFDESEAKIITDVLLMSDLYGIESHGMQRLNRYYNSIQKGMIVVENKGEVVFETPVSAVIDGQDGMGQIIGTRLWKWQSRRQRSAVSVWSPSVIPTITALPVTMPRWLVTRA